MSDTIAAIATGNVLSAIGILRLSGDGTLAVIDRVFHPANGRPMSEAPNRQLVYGAFCDTDGQTLDLCLCTVSRGPHSYTGEDTAELQCHGSPAVRVRGCRRCSPQERGRRWPGSLPSAPFSRAHGPHAAERSSTSARRDHARCEKPRSARRRGLRRAQSVYDARRTSPVTITP